MSSNSKTPLLGLNSWAGSDKPKRDDFNYDNEVIDTVVGEHINDQDLHLSTEEKEKLNAPFLISYYIGDGVNTRVLTLDFTPSLVIIFAHGVPLSTYDKETDHVYAFGGFATPLYSTAGIYIGENKLTVTESTGAPTMSNFYPRMNNSGYRYHYIAFK